MNNIEIKKHKGPSEYETEMFFIDGKPLYEYIIEWYKSQNCLPEDIPFAPVDMLAITWTNEYDFEGDARFMKYILEKDSAITPILSCPDDFDFSCIIIVAEVIKYEKSVVWKRLGKVDHSGEDLEEESRSGILHLASYTEEDWDKYGDNIALENIQSHEWMDWIGKNWSEELFRRRVNYTFPYYQNEKNIIWFAECNFEFDRTEYDSIIEKCYAE